VIISEKWKFIFVHIHKTAGDAIADALIPLLGKRDIVISGSVSQLLRRSFPLSSQAKYRTLHKHSVAEEIRAAVPVAAWDNYYKFSFVRDPVDRAISMYKYALTMRAKRENAPAWRRALFQTPIGARFDPISWPAVKAVAECNSFSSFLRHEGAMSDLGMLPQWLSVSDTHDGSVIVDAIGRYENLERDFYQIQRELGLPHVSIHSRNVSNKREVLASEADLALLQCRYWDDLIRFGFPQDLPVD
jgi:Sulfotransferase family